MKKRFFLDTNVLIHAQDPRQPEKQSHAVEWLAALAAHDAIVVSPLVVNEFSYVVRRKFPRIDSASLRDLVAAMQPWCLAPTTYETSIHGLALHFDSGFQFFDCVLLASAAQAGCAFFLSEDMRENRAIEDVRIINPFRISATQFLAAL